MLLQRLALRKEYLQENYLPKCAALGRAETKQMADHPTARNRVIHRYRRQGEFCAWLGLRFRPHQFSCRPQKPPPFSCWDQASALRSQTKSSGAQIALHRQSYRYQTRLIQRLFQSHSPLQPTHQRACHACEPHNKHLQLMWLLS